MLLPVLYLASFGPVCWCVARLPYYHVGRDLFETAYWPIGWIGDCGPRFVEQAVFSYAELGMPVGGDVRLPGCPGRPKDPRDLDDRPILLLRTRQKF